MRPSIVERSLAHFSYRLGPTREMVSAMRTPAPTNGAERTNARLSMRNVGET